MLLITHDLGVVAGMAHRGGADVRRPDRRGGRGGGLLLAARAPVCAAAAARAARPGAARRAAGRHCRQRAAADPALRRLPLRAALPAGGRRLPQSAARAGAVADGAAAQRALHPCRRAAAGRGRGHAAAAAPGGRHRRAAAVGRTADSALPDPRRPCCSGCAGTSRRSRTSASRSPQAARWRWWANPAAARRRSAKAIVQLLRRAGGDRGAGPARRAGPVRPAGRGAAHRPPLGADHLPGPVRCR